MIERALILSQGGRIRLDQIQIYPVQRARPDDHDTFKQMEGLEPDDLTIRSHERHHILRVCEGCIWKIKGVHGAAQKLGLNPATLYSRMKKLDIRKP